MPASRQSCDSFEAFVYGSETLRIPDGVWKIVKEVARHLLRRPVVGIALAAKTADGRFLLVRRGDSGGWALPGGTLEWGETLRAAADRELREETGAKLLDLGDLLGVYSAPERDPRFHAVTVVVAASVTEPLHGPDNPLEILEARLFSEAELPLELAHGMTDMLRLARNGERVWE
jgi:8-oxo-dGTP diphosphatase